MPLVPNSWTTRMHVWSISICTIFIPSMQLYISVYYLLFRDYVNMHGTDRWYRTCSASSVAKQLSTDSSFWSAPFSYIVLRLWYKMNVKFGLVNKYVSKLIKKFFFTRVVYLVSFQCTFKCWPYYMCACFYEFLKRPMRYCCCG